jgi:hypothetical protein
LCGGVLVQALGVLDEGVGELDQVGEVAALVQGEVDGKVLELAGVPVEVWVVGQVAEGGVVDCGVHKCLITLNLMALQIAQLGHKRKNLIASQFQQKLYSRHSGQFGGVGEENSLVSKMSRIFFFVNLLPALPEKL